MSHGIQFSNGDGSLGLENDETFCRLVGFQEVWTNTTSSFSMPPFDDTKGEFFITSSFFYTPSSNLSPILFPALSWNNTTKVMSYSPHTIPVGFDGTVRRDCFVKIIFVHFK